MDGYKAMMMMMITYHFKDFEHALTNNAIFGCFYAPKGMNFTQVLGGRGKDRGRGRVSER